MWGRGSIVWERRRQDHCLIFLWLKAVCCQQLQYFKLVILIYAYSIYTSHMCSWYRLALLLFFYIINVCHNLFKEIVQIYYVWLLTYVDYWFVGERHVVNLMINIITYVVYVSIVWSWWFLNLFLKIFKIINSPISRFDFSLNICIAPNQDRT